MPDRPPPPPDLPPPPASPARHVALDDLPPAVASRLSYEESAPRRVRSEKLPAEAREVFRDLWNDIVADIYDEVAGVRRTKLFDKDMVQRAIGRVAVRAQQAERALIIAAVHRPVQGDADWKHVAIGGAGGAAAAVSEELSAFGSFGTGATVAIASAIAGELFETYVASSGRTLQYRRAGRSPAPDLIVADLAESIGLSAARGNRASRELTRQAISWLDLHFVRSTTRRFARGLVPVLGVAAGAGLSGRAVRKVLRLPLRPPSEEEVWRLANGIVAAEQGEVSQPELER